MRWARLCSGHRLISLPASEIEPESTGNDPATALSRVDFPEPLVPMMTTNEPGSTLRLTPSSARSSLGVPGLKVLRIVSSSSMGRTRSFEVVSLEQPGGDQRQENKQRGDEFQVVGIEAHAESDGHQQPEKHRAHHRAYDAYPELPGADQCFSDDYARKAPHHHANSH